MSVTQERDALVPILEHMHVPQDGVLVVHSAIAPLSRRGFRAEAMIEAMLDYMRGGTVAMPTMTWRTVTPERPEWDELATPSHTGVLTEVFRTCYATGRSIHPTHSVAARGPHAQRLLARHHLDDTPVSANSPYGLMRDQDAYVLMLGVGLETCTAIHLPEETIAPEIYLRPAEQAELYECRDRHGVTHRVRTRRHWRLDRDFPKFGPPLERKGRMHAGDIAGCPYAIVGLMDLLDAVFAALNADLRGTLKSE
ncbi:MAG: AAC(3) family N-acetyltransferase [Xanthobacteraceae bacterium]